MIPKGKRALTTTANAGFNVIVTATLHPITRLRLARMLVRGHVLSSIFAPCPISPSVKPSTVSPSVGEPGYEEYFFALADRRDSMLCPAPPPILLPLTPYDHHLLDGGQDEREHYQRGGQKEHLGLSFAEVTLRPVVSE